MKKLLILCMVLMMLSGCGDKREVKRAVFAWDGAETEDGKLLDKYQMNLLPRIIRIEDDGAGKDDAKGLYHRA